MKEKIFKQPLQKDKMKMAIIVINFRDNKIIIECDTGITDTNGFHPLETIQIMSRKEPDPHKGIEIDNFTPLLDEILPAGTVRDTLIDKSMDQVLKFLEERYGLEAGSL